MPEVSLSPNLVPDWPDWTVAAGGLLGLNVLLQVPALLFGTLP